MANTRGGLAAARARGRKGGRKPALSVAQVADAQAKYDSREWTVAQIADLYRVPRTTLYNHLTTGSTAPGPDPVSPKPPPPAADETPPALPDDKQDRAPTAAQKPASPRPPAQSGRRRRGRTRYTKAELDAYQLEAVRGDSGDIIAYRVLVAGDVLGSVERAPYGHRGWIARDTHRRTQPHRGGTGRYAKTREHAVIDLLLGLDITSDP